MRRQFSTAVLGLLLLVLAASSRADEVTAAMCKADARLQTRVTLCSPRILVGELLERLSKQSGVALAADDWSTAASDAVAISLKDVPLSDAMNALWSVFSYRHSEWDWRRSSVKGAENKYVYTLRRPDYARFLAERLKEQVQTDFEAQAQKMLAALDMPTEQLKEAAKHDLLMDSLLEDGRVGPGMGILASLPPDTLLSILRGQTTLSIPISELSPENLKALHKGWDWEADAIVKQGFAKSSMLPEGDHVSILVQHDPSLIAPTFYVGTNRGDIGFFGGRYMEADWNQKMNSSWMQPGDAATDPSSNRVLAYPKRPTPTVGKTHALGDSLLRFSDAAHVPLVARIPHPLDAGTSADMLSHLLTAKTVQAFLEQVQGEPANLQHKWRGGVLLLACQNWFVSESEDARLPWAAVKRLRDAEAAGDGFLSLNDLAHAAGVLNEAQMKALGEWFPVMDNAAPWRDFLAFYDKTPEYRPHVLSAKGDAFQFPESLVNAKLGVDVLREKYPNLRLQIQQSPQAEDKPPTHRILFVLRDDDGVRPIGGQGFRFPAHEYQTSLRVDEGTPPSTNRASAAN